MGNGEEGKDEYEEWAKWMRPPEKKLLEAISINTTFKWMIKAVRDYFPKNLCCLLIIEFI